MNEDRHTPPSVKVGDRSGAMRGDPEAHADLRSSVVLVDKSIDNSQVVRELDPRSSRDLLSLLAVVGALVMGLVLYAWPHLQLRQTHTESMLMNREYERLVEQNRKLRLMRSVLQDLRRVEKIAVRELGLEKPPPERMIVVERPAPMSERARLASGELAAERTGASRNAKRDTGH